MLAYHQTISEPQMRCHPSRTMPAVPRASELPEAFLQFCIALNKFVNSVLALDSVKRVGIKARGESFSVWTFADEPSHETLEKIYTAELDFRTAIQEMIFDFAVKYEDTATVPPDFHVFEGR